jgi:O-antigen/teichoic acid export membrane protein
MSRLKRFALSLLSGYVQLGVNSLFTLVTVRLALRYLSDDEYGLWMPVTVIVGYIALMDFGLSGAAARILIDYKDHEKPEEYGGIIQTSAWVGLSQGALIFLVGTLLAFGLGPLLHIPANLERKFFWLVIGQCGVTAAMFATRIVALVLTANQRFDVNNYSGALALPVNCGVMWWGFAHGDGVFSMLWGQAAGVISALTFNWIGCYKLKLFPRKGQWGRPSWEKFRELFTFGRDVFLFMVGNQFINFSQTLLLTRLMGLKEALTWGICTRAYAILMQVIGRIFDFSTSALAEMMVRLEREQLLRRFREIETLSVNLAVAAAVLIAVANGPFVEVWTAGRIRWSPWNDLLLGVWLVMGMTVRVHTGLVGQAKAFRSLRYLYFIEGFAFIGLTILLHRFGGITMMLMVSILCSLCCTFPYGLWRTREYFHLSWGDLARWHRGTLALVATVAPVGVLVWWCARNLPALQRLMVEITVLGTWTACMLLRYGLGYSLRAEACRYAPSWARPILARIGFGNVEASDR